MKKCVILFIFGLQSISGLGNVSSSLAGYCDKREPVRYEYLKTVMKDFENQEWDDDEALCVELLTKIMRNVQNSTVWATWIWESMQNPVGHLYGSRCNYGNYDECVEFPWEKVHPDMRTQYCLTHIHLSEVDSQLDKVDFFGNVNNYIRAKTKHHLKFNTLRWGVCTPVACKTHSVAKFVNVLFKQTHLGLAVDKPNIFVSKCYIAGDNEASHGLGFYFTVSFIIFCVVFTLYATWIVSFKRLNQPYADIFEAFDIPSNIRSLVKVSKNDINCLFGIRMVTSCTVICAHVFWVMKAAGVSNALNLDKDYEPIVTVIFTSEMVVDTFLVVSSFLMVKSVLTEGLENFNFIKLIVKRYFRIMWLMGVVLLGLLNLFHDASRGPAVKEVFTSEIDACRKNWWTNLLLIQNYYDTENMCHVVGWSSNVDFHLSVLGLIITWVFMRNRRSGLLLFTISLIISIAVPALFVYSDYKYFSPMAIDFRVLDNYRATVFKHPTYIATHFRAGPYFVGMVVGYAMFKYNPGTHRQVINKKISRMGMCVLLVMFLGMYLLGYIVNNYDYSPMDAALYLSLKRIVWAVLSAVFIMICEYGTLPLLNGFLTWSVWAPFSKLSYGIYLVHPIIVYYISSTSRSPSQYDILSLVSLSSGIFVLSSLISLLLWIFFEAPMQNVISLLFKSRNKKINSEATKEPNGEGKNSFGDLSNKKVK